MLILKFKMNNQYEKSTKKSLKVGGTSKYAGILKQSACTTTAATNLILPHLL